jgi:predicted enzyme related to lactoylglutathione lyase
MGRPVTKFQILAKDPERTAGFYGALFDWRVNADNAFGYRALETGAGRGIDGGIWPSPPEGHAFVQLFVEVDDVADTIARATQLGARVVVPPSVLPDGDEMAVILDPEGIPLALHRPAR